jgi:hypothetical protein
LLLVPAVTEPTAQALLAEVAATPDRLPGRLELGTCFHAVPFHRRISVVVLVPVLEKVSPTAQASPVETAATPERTLSAGAGLGTCFHPVPFQCSIRAFPLLVKQLVQPTDQALLAEAADTPLSWLWTYVTLPADLV